MHGGSGGIIESPSEGEKIAMDEVLTSTSISEEELKSYSSVLAKLDEFFKVHRNVIYERGCFNKCSHK